MKRIFASVLLSALLIPGLAFAEMPQAGQAADAIKKEIPEKPMKKMVRKTVQKDMDGTKKTMPKKIGNYKGTGSRSMARFNKVDGDGNGNVSQAEFTKSHLASFQKKDKNKDGNLSAAEFSPTLAKKGMKNM